MPKKRCKAAGSARERKVKQGLEERGWTVTRAPASIGAGDLMAIKPNWPALLVQVKANKDGGPYMNFRPPERQELIDAAKKAGADAYLVWWPPHGKEQWIHSDYWPKAKVAA